MRMRETIFVVAAVAALASAAAGRAEATAAATPLSFTASPEAAAPAGPSAVGPALDLAGALDEGMQRSPSYRRAQAVASEKGWARLEAASAFLPRVTLDGTRFFENQFQTLPVSLGPVSLVFPEVFPYEQLAFNATWTVFDGFAGVNLMRSSELMGRAADLQRDWALFGLRQTVRLRFYQALGQQKLEALAEENVKTLTDHLRIVKDLLENGRATRFDLLRVEVQLDDAQTERLAALDRVYLARRQLALAMGEEGDDRPLAGELPPPGRAPAAAPAVDDKPDVKAKLLEADAAHTARLAASGHWAPRVTVLGSYGWYGNGYSGDQMDPSATGSTGTAYDVGLAASWELFNGGGSLARELQAGRKADEALETARQARLQASYDRDFWGKRLVLSASLYQAKLADVDKSAESVRLATLGLQAGTRTTTEVLDAELDSFRASASVVSAQMDAAEALINLELALGKGDLP